MALNNPRRTRRYLALGLADEPIAVPETVYAQVREKNRQSLVCRVLSPRRQDLYSVIDNSVLSGVSEDMNVMDALSAAGSVSSCLRKSGI